MLLLVPPVGVSVLLFTAGLFGAGGIELTLLLRVANWLVPRVVMLFVPRPILLVATPKLFCPKPPPTGGLFWLEFNGG